MKLLKDKLNSIPDTWSISKLEDVCIKITDGAHYSPKTQENGYPIATVENMKSSYIDVDSCRKISLEDFIKLKNNSCSPELNDVLFSKDGTIGKTFVYKQDDDIVLLSSIAIIKTNNELLYPEFCSYFLQSPLFYSSLENIKSGSAIKRVVLKDLKTTILPLPPLSEQRKIAAILSSVDEAIEKTEAIIEQTEKVKKGLMKQLLTKGIGHTKFKKTEIGEIPEEWEVKELKDLANPYDKYSFTGGPFGSDLTSEDYTEEGVQIIQLQNIKEGYFSNDYKIFTSEEKANQLSSCNIYPGDIIIAKMADPVARACIVPNHSKRFLMASDGIRLSVDKRKYVTEYVTYAINAPYFRKQAINNSTGTTRLRIGLSALRKLKILIPSYEEQQKIADIMTTIDQKIEFEKMKIKKLTDIKKSLMQSLLTGKVRVKVDEDEVMSS
jgi:type I restriction enzyme, S subunit